MRHKPLHLTIVNDSRVEPSCSDCEGGTMTSAQLQFIVGQLGEAYGDHLQIDVIDLAQTPDRHWQKVVDEAKGQPPLTGGGQGAALPLLALNGVPRLWGKFDYRMAAEVIEVQREMGVG